MDNFNQTSSPARYLWADIIRIIAIISVVFIHVSCDVFYQWNKIPLSWWHIGNFYDSASRIGVPLFILLSGSLLLGKNEDYLVFFNKRFKRVVIPYIVWTIIFLIYIKYYESRPLTIIDAIVLTFTGKVYAHLIFFNYFLGIYLFVPILRKFVNRASNRDLIYFIALWFLFASFLPFFQRLASNYFNVESKYFRFLISAPHFTGFFGLFLTGYFLTLNIERMKRLIIPVSGYLFGLSVTIVGAFMLIKSSDKTDEFFYGYLTPNVIIMSLSVFLLVQLLTPKHAIKISRNVQKTLELLSRASYGVFFSHLIILRFLKDGVFGFSIHGTAFDPLLSVPITVLITLFLSYLLIILLMGIPRLKNLIT